MTYRRLRALPTDPTRTTARSGLTPTARGPTHEKAALEAIGAMLNKVTSLPDVDAALHRAAARIPGVSGPSMPRDAAGRRDIGLACRHGDDRHV
ncbi:hypothetical protein [Streptomyces sp. Ru72]|uniref:hypothetical protein n=1 Tax=Streptomyces sp. Ru72 TaxID=2080747 RepID=UPI0011B0C636|nr:hypothetical protein [Streptomyces sp. Ru72]